MKKCLRCEEENIKEDYKYCPICGIKLGTAQEPVQEQIKKLEEVCKPVVDYLKENYSPHSTAVITDSRIRLMKDEIGIPIRSDD